MTLPRRPMRPAHVLPKARPDAPRAQLNVPPARPTAGLNGPGLPPVQRPIFAVRDRIPQRRRDWIMSTIMGDDGGVYFSFESETSHKMLICSRFLPLEVIQLVEQASLACLMLGAPPHVIDGRPTLLVGGNEIGECVMFCLASRRLRHLRGYDFLPGEVYFGWSRQKYIIDQPTMIEWLACESRMSELQVSSLLAEGIFLRDAVTEVPWDRLEEFRPAEPFSVFCGKWSPEDNATGLGRMMERRPYRPGQPDLTWEEIITAKGFNPEENGNGQLIIWSYDDRPLTHLELPGAIHKMLATVSPVSLFGTRSNGLPPFDVMFSANGYIVFAYTKARLKTHAQGRGIPGLMALYLGQLTYPEYKVKIQDNVPKIATRTRVMYEYWGSILANYLKIFQLQSYWTAVGEPLFTEQECQLIAEKANRGEDLRKITKEKSEWFIDAAVRWPNMCPAIRLAGAIVNRLMSRSPLDDDREVLDRELSFFSRDPMEHHELMAVLKIMQDGMNDLFRLGSYLQGYARRMRKKGFFYIPSSPSATLILGRITGSEDGGGFTRIHIDRLHRMWFKYRNHPGCPTGFLFLNIQTEQEYTELLYDALSTKTFSHFVFYLFLLLKMPIGLNQEIDEYGEPKYIEDSAFAHLIYCVRWHEDRIANRDERGVQPTYVAMQVLRQEREGCKGRPAGIVGDVDQALCAVAAVIQSKFSSFHWIRRSWNTEKNRSDLARIAQAGALLATGRNETPFVLNGDLSSSTTPMDNTAIYGISREVLRAYCKASKETPTFEELAEKHRAVDRRQLPSGDLPTGDDVVEANIFSQIVPLIDETTWGEMLYVLDNAVCVQRLTHDVLAGEQNLDNVEDLAGRPGYSHIWDDFICAFDRNMLGRILGVCFALHVPPVNVILKVKRKSCIVPRIIHYQDVGSSQDYFPGLGQTVEVPPALEIVNSCIDTAYPPDVDPSTPSSIARIVPYLEQVLLALNKGKSVVVSLPTGFGKTTILLPALAACLDKSVLVALPVRDLTWQTANWVNRCSPSIVVDWSTGGSEANRSFNPAAKLLYSSGPRSVNILTGGRFNPSVYVRDEAHAMTAEGVVAVAKAAGIPIILLSASQGIRKFGEENGYSLVGEPEAPHPNIYYNYGRGHPIENIDGMIDYVVGRQEICIAVVCSRKEVSRLYYAALQRVTQRQLQGRCPVITRLDPEGNQNPQFDAVIADREGYGIVVVTWASATGTNFVNAGRAYVVSEVFHKFTCPIRGFSLLIKIPASASDELQAGGRLRLFSRQRVDVFMEKSRAEHRPIQHGYRSECAMGLAFALSPSEILRLDPAYQPGFHQYHGALSGLLRAGYILPSSLEPSQEYEDMARNGSSGAINNICLAQCLRGETRIGLAIFLALEQDSFPANEILAPFAEEFRLGNGLVTLARQIPALARQSRISRSVSECIESEANCRYDGEIPAEEVLARRFSRSAVFLPAPGEPGRYERSDNQGNVLFIEVKHAMGGLVRLPPMEKPGWYVPLSVQVLGERLIFSFCVPCNRPPDPVNIPVIRNLRSLETACPGYATYIKNNGRWGYGEIGKCTQASSDDPIVRMQKKDYLSINDWLWTNRESFKMLERIILESPHLTTTSGVSLIQARMNTSCLLNTNTVLLECMMRARSHLVHLRNRMDFGGKEMEDLFEEFLKTDLRFTFAAGGDDLTACGTKFCALADILRCVLGPTPSRSVFGALRKGTLMVLCQEGVVHDPTAPNSFRPVTKLRPRMAIRGFFSKRAFALDRAHHGEWRDFNWDAVPGPLMNTFLTEWHSFVGKDTVIPVIQQLLGRRVLEGTEKTHAPLLRKIISSGRGELLPSKAYIALRIILTRGSSSRVSPEIKFLAESIMDPEVVRLTLADFPDLEAGLVHGRSLIKELRGSVYRRLQNISPCVRQYLTASRIPSPAEASIMIDDLIEEVGRNEEEWLSRRGWEISPRDFLRLRNALSNNE